MFQPILSTINMIFSVRYIKYERIHEGEEEEKIATSDDENEHV